MSINSDEEQEKYEKMKQDDINKNIGIKENREKNNNVSEEFNMNMKNSFAKLEDFENNCEFLDNNEQRNVNMYSYNPTSLNNNTPSNNLLCYNNMKMEKIQIYNIIIII